ncbi:hypothetical protein BOX15_Mlig030478g1, partial [Macrostomum lignano]
TDAARAPQLTALGACQQQQQQSASGLSEAARRRAEQELGETPETRSAALSALRSAIQSDATMRCRTDDAFLLKFLRHRKFNVDGAHKRIRAYLRVRRKFPDVFDDYGPAGVRPVLEDGVLVVLPHRDGEGRRIVLYRLGLWDCAKYSSTELVRATCVVMEALLEEEDTQVCGVSVVLDMSGLALRHIRRLDLRYFRRYRAVVHKALPVRVCALNVVRGGRFFNTTCRVASALLPSKLADRVHNHGDDVAALHACVPAALLPPEPPFHGCLAVQLPLTPFYHQLMSGHWTEWFGQNSLQCINDDESGSGD